MTSILVETLADARDGSRVLDATITATATRARATGAILKLPEPVEVRLRRGQLAAPLILDAPDGTWAWKISVRPTGAPLRHAMTGTYRFAGATVTWADLEPVDPRTLIPMNPVPPNVQQVLEQAAAKAQAAETAAANAASAQASSAGYASSASGSADDAAAAAAVAVAAQFQDRAYDSVVSRLDMRAPAPVTFALCSDSTGDDPNEWFETFARESAAALWPDRPARVQRWGKTPDAYPGTWTTWQTGATPPIPAFTDPNAVIGKDTFSRTVADMVGDFPEVGGGAWAGTAAAWASNGSRMVKTNGTAAAQLVFNLLPREGTNLAMSFVWRLATNTAGTKQTLVNLMRVTATARIYYLLQGTSSPTITLAVVGPAGTRTVEVLPANVIPGGVGPTDYPVSFSLVGNQATASINGHTSTFTVNADELTALSSGTSVFWIQSTDADFQIDNVDVRGTVTTPAQPGGPSDLSPLSVYNGAVAGTTAEYAVERMDRMFPVRPDLIFINHGHNYVAAVDPTQFLESIQDFVDALHAKYDEGIPVVVLSQNPRFDPATRIAEHRERQIALRSYARSKGWEYIPGFEQFAARIDGGKSLVQADGVHPTYSSNPTTVTGGRIVANAARKWIESRSERG